MKKPELKQLYDAWLPIRERRGIRALQNVLEASKPKRDSTHWDGCWEVHRECALREFNRIRADE